MPNGVVILFMLKFAVQEHMMGGLELMTEQELLNKVEKTACSVCFKITGELSLSDEIARAVENFLKTSGWKSPEEIKGIQLDAINKYLDGLKQFDPSAPAERVVERVCKNHHPGDYDECLYPCHNKICITDTGIIEVTERAVKDCSENCLLQEIISERELRCHDYKTCKYKTPKRPLTNAEVFEIGKQNVEWEEVR